MPDFNKLPYSLRLQGDYHNIYFCSIVFCFVFQVSLTGNVGFGFTAASYEKDALNRFLENGLPFTMISDNLLLGGSRELEPRFKPFLCKVLLVKLLA